MTETDLMRERYARRDRAEITDLYDPCHPWVYMAEQERQRTLIHWIRTCNIAPISEKRVLEIGCGTGSNLLQLILLGFQPENVVGNELLEERAEKARQRLPAASRVLVGNAAELSLQEGPFDIIYQATVFTSVLDTAFQHQLADRVWELTRVGGGVLWYDFVFDNPNNPDVRGISTKQIQALFPTGKLKVWRLTLAPPISRRVTRLHPVFYSVFNALPVLRTHVLCWIEKTA